MNKLLNKNYILLWQGQFVSKFGDQFFSMALMIWLTYDLDSPALMGTLLMAGGIVSLVLGPFAGTLADRASRKAIIVLTDLVNGVVVTAFAALFLVQPDNERLLIITLFGVTIINAILRSFFSPAISASIPDLVPKSGLNAANSMGQFSSRISQLVGTPVASMLYPILGVPLMFLFNGVSFLFSSISELFISIPKVKRTPVDTESGLSSFKDDLKEGFRYVWNNPGLKATVIVSAGLSFFSVPIITLISFFIKDFLRAGAMWLGIISAVYSIGALIGFSVAAVMKVEKTKRANLLMGLIVFQGALFVLLAIQRLPLSASVFVLLLGIGDGIINVNIMTIIQLTTPTEIRGRVFGVLAMISGSLAPLAMGTSGFVASALDHNIPLIYMICGGAMLLLAIGAMCFRDYREFLVYDDASDDEAE